MDGWTHDSWDSCNSYESIETTQPNHSPAEPLPPVLRVRVRGSWVGLDYCSALSALLPHAIVLLLTCYCMLLTCRRGGFIESWRVRALRVWAFGVHLVWSSACVAPVGRAGLDSLYLPRLEPLLGGLRRWAFGGGFSAWDTVSIGGDERCRVWRAVGGCE